MPDKGAMEVKNSRSLAHVVDWEIRKKKQNTKKDQANEDYAYLETYDYNWINEW